MWAICEKTATVGSVASRDNGRLWYSELRGTTPASNEATQYDTKELADQIIDAESLGDRWVAVEVGE